jgi:alpha-tubulin suppressor-like RCC1 family protein
VTNVDGEEMDRSLQWSSDNADVATVDNTGLAAAVAPGEATIEARAGNVRGSTVLTVEDAPAGLVIQAQTISGGHRHGCGVAASGQGVCWGTAFWGVDEVVRDPENPRDVTMPPGVLFASINASENHTVALSTTGAAYAWGGNASGQLGNETFVSSNIPVEVKMPEGVKFVSVQAGNGFSVALSTTGEAWGWGNGANGSGVASNVPVRVAQPESVTFVSISAYASFTAALTDGGFVYTWGANNEGQLGIGGRTARLTPVLVNMSGASIASVTAGQHHAVAVATTGEAYAWGRNSSGQLGNNSLTLSERPVTVIMPEGVTFAAVSAGGNHNIAISPTGIAYGWGFNGQGQVGTGPATVSRVPSLVIMPPGVDSFVAIATGNSFSMAITPSGQLYTWGRNFYYELADGTRENRFTPVLAVGGRLFAR